MGQIATISISLVQTVRNSVKLEWLLKKLPLINGAHTVLNPAFIHTDDTVTVRGGMSAFST